MHKRWADTAILPFLLALVIGFADLSGRPSAAQVACVAAQEPNEQPEAAMPLTSGFCVEGTVGQGDQEIFAWTVSAEEAKWPWNITIDGPANVQSRVQLHRIEEAGDAATPAVIGPEAFPGDAARTGACRTANAFRDAWRLDDRRLGKLGRWILSPPLRTGRGRG